MLVRCPVLLAPRCHVVVRQGFNSLNESSEDEEDLLDAAWGLEATSRLSCQVQLGDEDITIEIPKYTINHARENHKVRSNSDQILLIFVD